MNLLLPKMEGAIVKKALFLYAALAVLVPLYGLRATAYDLAYSTYLGGASDDQLRDTTSDDQGYAYITGGTESSDFPTTPGASRGSLSMFDFRIRIGS